MSIMKVFFILYFHIFLQILVEFDDVDWETREWLNVYKDNYHLLAVEKSMVLANRSEQSSSGHLHPALVILLQAALD